MRKKHYPQLRALILTALSIVVISPAAWASSHLNLDTARKEGKLTVYSSISLEDISTLAKAFEQKYPWIKVEVYRAGKIKLGERMLTEARAGKHRFDVLLSSAFTTLEMKSQNLLARYESPAKVHYPAELTDPQGYWTAAQINPMTVGYNTKLVRKNELPRRWEDLLDSKWKGKIAINPNRPEWYIAILQMLGKEKGRKYMQSLSALETVPTRSATLAREFLAAGEYPLYANAASGNMEEYKKKGAPVDWVRLDTLPSYPILTSVSSHSKSPNSARLMADFLLSEEGQNVFKTIQRIPARNGIDPDPPYLTKGVNIFHMDIAGLSGTLADTLEEEFRKAFGLR